MAPVTKAVIPAAGLGTRFLPATKATPKEMLPVVDKPAIQYVVEEAVAAGLSDVLMITGRNKRPLEDHFDRNYELEADAGEQERPEPSCPRCGASTDLAQVHYVRQGDANGLGHAVLCAERHVGDNAFAVMLGDDLIDARDPLLRQMIEVHEATGQSVIALIEVPHEQIGMYGCAAVAPLATPAGVDDDPEIVQVTELVEKPDPDVAPSDLAMIGRYVLTPQVFAVLHETGPAAAARSS